MNNFFEQLNRDLKQSNGALPRLIVDDQALEQNLQYVAKKLKYGSHLQPRIVVKSLACLALLKTISLKFRLNGLWCFICHSFCQSLRTFRM